jgi:hypothetical protein
MTGCVAAYLCRWGFGGRPKSALAIRPRSAGPARLPGSRGDLLLVPRRAPQARVPGVIAGGRRELHEEGARRVLEGGDRTMGVREGSLEMGEDLRRRPVCGRSGQSGRQLRRRAARRECRADLALCQVEAFPDAQQGPAAEVAVDSADGREETAGDGELKETPQKGGSQAKASDLVGVPDAEGASATGASLAVAAKDASCA